MTDPIPSPDTPIDLPALLASATATEAHFRAQAARWQAAWDQWDADRPRREAADRALDARLAALQDRAAAHRQHMDALWEDFEQRQQASGTTPTLRERVEQLTTQLTQLEDSVGLLHTKLETLLAYLISRESGEEAL